MAKDLDNTNIDLYIDDLFKPSSKIYREKSDKIKMQYYYRILLTKAIDG